MKTFKVLFLFLTIYSSSLYAQKDGKKVNYAISTFYDRFDYGGVRHLTTVQARFKLLPKLESTLSGEFGQIKDLYEIDQKEVFGFRVLLKYMMQ